VREAAESRYDEGYERGVHDHDATLILDTLLRLRDSAGMLRYLPEARAAAQLFWAHGVDEVSRKTLATRAVSLVRAREVFGPGPALEALSAELGALIAAFLATVGLPDTDASMAGEYLVEELATTPAGFVTGKAA